MLSIPAQLSTSEGDFLHDKYRLEGSEPRLTAMLSNVRLISRTDALPLSACGSKTLFKTKEGHSAATLDRLSYFSF